MSGRNCEGFWIIDACEGESAGVTKLRILIVVVREKANDVRNERVVAQFSGGDSGEHADARRFVAQQSSCFTLGVKSGIANGFGDLRSHFRILVIGERSDPL